MKKWEIEDIKWKTHPEYSTMLTFLYDQEPMISVAFSDDLKIEDLKAIKDAVQRIISNTLNDRIYLPQLLEAQEKFKK